MQEHARAASKSVADLRLRPQHRHKRKTVPVQLLSGMGPTLIHVELTTEGPSGSRIALSCPKCQQSRRSGMWGERGGGGAGWLQSSMPCEVMGLQRGQLLRHIVGIKSGTIACFSTAPSYRWLSQVELDKMMGSRLKVCFATGRSGNAGFGRAWLCSMSANLPTLKDKTDTNLRPLKDKGWAAAVGCSTRSQDRQVAWHDLRLLKAYRRSHVRMQIAKPNFGEAVG